MDRQTYIKAYDVLCKIEELVDYAIQQLNQIELEESQLQ